MKHPFGCLFDLNKLLIVMDDILTLRGWSVIDESGTKQRTDITIETKGVKGKILEISDVGKRDAKFKDAPIYELSNSQIVFPGLIDLHTHLPYKYMPLLPDVGPTHKRFSERYDWQGFITHSTSLKSLDTTRVSKKDENPDTKEELIEKPAIQSVIKMEKCHAEIKKKIKPKDLQNYCQVGSLIGGTSTIQDNHRDENEHLIIRSTGMSEDIFFEEPKETHKVISFVRFFSPSIRSLRSVEKNYPEINKDLEWVLENHEKTKTLLLHLAEGKSSSSLERREELPNGYIQQEFSAFKKIYLENKDKFSSIKVGLVHCSGMKGKSDLEFIKKNGIFIVWSPISNLLLYHNTLDIKTLLDKDIPVVLSSDWTPSGSKYVWDEAKNILDYFEVKTGLKKHEAKVKLYKMLTGEPARLLGQSQNLGALKEGCQADLFILDVEKEIKEKDHALDLFFEANDGQTAAIFVGGEIVFCDSKNFSLLQKDELDGFQQVFCDDNRRLVKRVNQTKSILEMDEELNLLLEKKHLPKTILGVSNDEVYKERISQLKENILTGNPKRSIPRDWEKDSIKPSSRSHDYKKEKTQLPKEKKEELESRPKATKKMRT